MNLVGQNSVQPIIGIIDSGIDKEFLIKYAVHIDAAASFIVHTENKTIEMIEYDVNDIRNWHGNIPEDISDENGHGIAVFSIIWKRYPEAHYVIAKVLGEDNKGYSVCLVEAFRWMIEEIIPDFINFSLGTDDESVCEEFYNLTQVAQKKGIQLYAALGQILSWPATFDTVYSVSDKKNCDLMENESKWMINKVIMDDKINLWQNGGWIDMDIKASWACALAAGEEKLIKLERTKKPDSNNLYLFTFPSFYGGADTRVAETIKIWTKFMNITIVPSFDHLLSDNYWIEYFKQYQVKISRLEDLPRKLDGYALSISNELFFKNRIADKLKEKGLYIIQSNDMDYCYNEELDAVKNGLVDCVLYTSEFQRNIIRGQYKKANPNIEEHIVDNYIDPTSFPYKERIFFKKESKRPFTIGRLSRADLRKYPENFPVFYEALKLKNPIYRIMAWDDDLNKKYNWHQFDNKRWHLLKANEERTVDFLYSLDAFVYPLGHRFKESYGRAIVEAMLTGLPVVVPNGHNFPSMVEHGKSVFLCSTFDEWVEYCSRLEDDIKLRMKMGKEAHVIARKVLCDENRHISQWKDVFGVK